MQLERGAEVLVQVVVWPEEAAQAGDGGECPASIERAGELGELRQLAHRGLALAGSRVGLDEIGRIRQEARLTHAVALGQVRDRYELLDRSQWARQTQLEQTERRLKPSSEEEVSDSALSQVVGASNVLARLRLATLDRGQPGKVGKVEGDRNRNPDRLRHAQ